MIAGLAERADHLLELRAKADDFSRRRVELEAAGAPIADPALWAEFQEVHDQLLAGVTQLENQLLGFIFGE